MLSDHEVCVGGGTTSPLQHTVIMLKDLLDLLYFYASLSTTHYE